MCYGVSGEDIIVTWAGETVELTDDDYEKKEDYSISGFEMDRSVLFNFELTVWPVLFEYLVLYILEL